MSDLKTELELAQRLFGSSNGGGLGEPNMRRIDATATADSSDGSVTVDVGGEAITVPVVGAVAEGDEVTILVENGSPVAIGTSGWGDAVQAVADEAAAVANATGQHFWTDTAGVHVTEVEADDWNDSTSQDYHAGPNVLLNSQGQLFRSGLTDLASFTPSGINFYSSDGYATASFNSSGVVIGDVRGSRFEVASDSLWMHELSGGDALKISDSDTADSETVLFNGSVAGGQGEGAVEDWVRGQVVKAWWNHPREGLRPLPSGVTFTVSDPYTQGSLTKFSWSLTNTTQNSYPVRVVRMVPGGGLVYGNGPFVVKYETGDVICNDLEAVTVNGIDPNGIAISVGTTTGQPTYITASTTEPQAADDTGWHVERLHDRILDETVVRASGIIHNTAISITTAIGGFYRSGTYYVPLPTAAKGILSITGLGFGSAMGGSSVPGMGTLPVGAASTWQYAASNAITSLQVYFTNTASNSSRNIYQPIEIIYIE